MDDTPKKQKEHLRFLLLGGGTFTQNQLKTPTSLSNERPLCSPLLLSLLLSHTTLATVVWCFAQHFSYSTRSFCKYLKLRELSENVVSGM
jgi:hypothetical protein